MWTQLEEEKKEQAVKMKGNPFEKKMNGEEEEGVFSAPLKFWGGSTPMGVLWGLRGTQGQWQVDPRHGCLWGWERWVKNWV
jgi:hypothetical protein